jgi:membrane fusion protein (multidrug efflux system)
MNTHSIFSPTVNPSLLKYLPFIAVLLMTTMLGGCGQVEAVNEDDAEVEVAKLIPIPVEVGATTIGSISSNYATTAVLEAKEEAFVVARASGIIEEIMVEEGDYVEKGQVLAKLEPQRYILNLRRAAADLRGIEKELAKINKVFSQNLVSADTYDKITAQYESAKAVLALAQLDLKEATIVAPISGYIAERNAKVGNLTESFQRERMFHIVQIKDLYGIVHLPEKELAMVHKDQKASLKVAALNDKQIIAYVERISPVIDPSTGTFKVTLRVPNTENTLKAGMFTQVSLNYNTRENATLVPRKALISLDDKVNVFVVNAQGIATKRTIKIGYQEGNFVEVIEGLDANLQVVITGHQNLKNNAFVNVVNG